MRNHVRNSRSERTQPAPGEGHEREFAPTGLLEETDIAEDTDDDLSDVVRLHCPDCGQPIAVLPDDDLLPEHALCPTPWNPFGLTVCAGSGREVRDARPPAGEEPGGELELAVLLTLPAGLDWRTQPFSHVGGPGSQPMRTSPRLAA